MKIKDLIVVFDINFHKIAEGKENGWEWFRDPARNILLFLAPYSTPLENLIPNEKFEKYDEMEENLKTRRLSGEKILYVSDLSWRLNWAKERNFDTLAMSSSSKQTEGGDATRLPDGDSIVRYLNFLAQKK